MEPEQSLILQWYEHKSSLVSTFVKHFERNTFVDCTLAAEGQYLNVHKMILSACSPYFEILLNENRDKHPIIILKDIKFRSLKYIVEFMYRGEANVLSTEMKEFLAAAETLQINGLVTQGRDDTRSQPTEDLTIDMGTHNLPPCSKGTSEKDIWIDSELSSTLTETVEKPCLVTQETPVLLSQEDAGTNIPRKVQKFLVQESPEEEIDIDEEWFKTEESNEIPRFISPPLPSPLSLGSHTIEAVHPVSTERMPILNACSASTQKVVPRTSDAPMAMEATPEVETEQELSPPAAVDIEVGESARHYSSVIKLSDTTDAWAEEDMEKNLTASQEIGESFRDGTGESRARFDAVSEVTRESMPRDLSSEQGRIPNECARIKSISSVGPQTLLKRQDLQVDDEDRASLSKTLVKKALPHRCTYCDKSFRILSHLKRHERIHPEHEPVSWSECPKTFSSKTELWRHMPTHTDRKPFRCPECSESFAGKNDLQEHMEIHIGHKPHRCSVCLKTFSLKRLLKRHMRIHKSERPFKGEEWSKAFDQKNDLQKHMLINTDHKPHSCSVCLKTFTRKDNLKTHMLIHSDHKPHSCLVCLKTFSRKGTLKTHMLTHSDHKPHSCSVCLKTFSQKNTLKIHMLIHTEEKPHSCSVCLKTFSRKGTLNSHMLTHSGHKPHSCSVCLKTFSRKGTVKTHMLTHSGHKPHSCSVCLKTFSRKGNLKTHMSTHSDHKPHSCSVCLKTFSQKNNLKRHMLIHSEEKPHSCSVCLKTFSRKGTLNNHMLTHWP